MAIDPRLPIPIEERNKPLEGDWMRMRRRLDELLRKLMQPKYYATGTITITNGIDEAAVTPTTLPVSSSTIVALTGFSGGTALDSVTAYLEVVGSTIRATRTGTSGDLVVSYVAFNP